MKRDEVIQIRVSPSEKLQINRHFKNENLSDYIRNHLLEVSQDSKVDTSNEQDLYELFKQFLGDDKVAKDIFTRFAKETHLGDCNDVVMTEDDGTDLVWYQGKQISYSELERLDREYKNNQ